MSDRIFFPLALLVAVLMIGGAMMVGRDVPICGPMGGAKGPADYSRIAIAKGDLCRMEAGGAGFELSAGESAGGSLIIRLEPGERNGEIEKNAHFKLGPDLETVYAGQKLKIFVTARPAEAAGAMAFQINYSTGKAGQSGWQTFQMRPGWNTYEYAYNVPQKLLKEAVALDYFAIRPVVPNKARAVEIRSIVFTRHGYWGED